MIIKTNLKTYNGDYDIVMIRTDNEKVYCNGVLFDPLLTEIEVVYTEQDEWNIENMADGCTVYCEFPDTVPLRIVEDMMEWYKNQ